MTPVRVYRGIERDTEILSSVLQCSDLGFMVSYEILPIFFFSQGPLLVF